MSHGETFSVIKGTIPAAADKEQLYRRAIDSLAGMLAAETEATLVMASIVAVLHQTMPHYFWTGFYRVCGDALLVGPYQGTPACLRIRHGHGVCGTAWAQERTAPCWKRWRAVFLRTEFPVRVCSPEALRTETSLPRERESSPPPFP